METLKDGDGRFEMVGDRRVPWALVWPRVPHRSVLIQTYERTPGHLYTTPRLWGHLTDPGLTRPL